MSANRSTSKTGSTTPRSTSPSTPKAKLSSPPSAPSSGSAPRPMPPIDHSQVLSGWNALPAASVRAQDFALGSIDNIFLRLQSEFTKLSAMEASMNVQNQHLAEQEHKVKAEEKKSRERNEDADKKLERVKQERQKLAQEKTTVAAQYDTAVFQEKENSKLKTRLREAADALRSREAAVDLKERDVARREFWVEKREKEMNRKTRVVGDIDIAGIDFSGLETLGAAAYDPHARSLSTLGDGAADEKVVSEVLSVLSDDDEPPRGRTLTSPSFQQDHDIPGSATSTSFRAMRIFHAAEISPLRRRPVLPRRVSSANMSCDTPTPTRMTADGDETASVETGVEGESVYESAEENVATAVQVGRARGRSVRRVSRHDNFRR